MADLDYVRVVGRFGIVVRDEAADDPNLEPDTIWCDAGTILFTPLITAVKVVDATPVPVTLGQSVIEGEIDADGYLSLRGTREIQFVDLGSTKVNPYIGAGKATHKVEFLGLSADGVPVNLPSPVNVRLSADMVSPTGTIDLTLVSPVPVAGGTAQVVGPAGPSAYEGWLAQGNTGTFDDFMTEGFADNESYVSALTSAQNAANSATAALASQNAAASSATAAASSATAASGSASAASTSASNASGSATAAAGSATSASTSASTATTKASEASTSATNAASSATAAAGSATAASNSASSAATSATNASNSASSAGTSASSASNSATTATTKANEASASASQAETAASGAVAVAVGGSLPQLYTNLVTNPSFEVNTSGWLAEAQATIARVGTDAKFGSHSLEITQASVGGGASAYTDISGLTPTRTYVVSAWVRTHVGSNGVGFFVGNSGSGNPSSVVSTNAFVRASSWTRITMPFVASATSHRLFMYNGSSYGVASVTAGDKCLVDGVMVTETPTPVPYFDGSSPGCYWLGTANASASVKMVFNRDDLDPVVRTDRSALGVTNLYPDPAVSQTVLSGWTAQPNTTLTVSSDNMLGLTSGSLTHTIGNAGTTNTGVQYAFNLVVGRTYTFSAYVKRLAGTGGYQLSYGAGTLVSRNRVDSSSWTRVYITFTASATSTTMFGVPTLSAVDGTTSSEAGASWRITGIQMLDTSVLTDYFDGDSKWSYWTGTPHNSTSVYAPPQAEDLVLKRNVPVVYTNLITNPSFETGLAPMGPAGSTIATITKDSTKSFSGSSSIKVVSTSSSNNSGVFHNAPRPTVSPNKTYTSSIYVNPDNAGEYKFETRFWTGGGSPSLISAHTDVKTLAAGSWTRFVLTLVVPATAGSVDFVVRMPDNSVAYVDALMLTETPHPVDYFDGSSPGCEWTGTPHASTSIKRFKSKQVDLNNVPSYAENLLTQSFPRWFGSGGSGSTVYTRETDISGTCIKKTWTVAPASPEDTGHEFTDIRELNGRRVRISAGQKLFFGTKIKTSILQSIRLRAVFYDVAGNVVLASNSPYETFAPNVAKSITYELVAPVNAVEALCVSYVAPNYNWTVGSTYIAGENRVFVDNVSAFFDGDTEGCYWTGTPNASTSVKKFPKRDDVFLTSRMPELARNLVSAPNFDSLTGHWEWNAVPTGTLAIEPFGETTALKLTRTSGQTIVVTQNPSTRVPVTPGEILTASLKVTTDATVGDVTLHIMYLNSSGGLVTYSEQTSTIGATAATTVLKLKNSVVPAGATTASLRFHIDSGGDGVAFVQSAYLSKSATHSEYFDGDSPGAIWLGTPKRSQSVRYAPSKQDYNLLTWLDAGRAQGVGSPEGVVTATVGTRYVDTAATNGAIEWMKFTGTGATGWRVTEGDTGWRRVISAGEITALPNMSVYAKRSADEVTVMTVESVASNSPGLQPLWSVPAGFRMATTSPALIASGLVVDQTGTIISASGVSMANIGSPVLNLRATANARHYATIKWSASEVWPTTLPGMSA